MQAAYLLRFPSWFIYRDRRAIGRWRTDDDSFLFGETPYDVACAIVERMALGANDVLYDVGCGRGKMVFAAHLASGCRAVGVDLLPTYVQLARRIASRLGLHAIQFEQEDALHIPLTDATAVYLNAFTFSDDAIAGLQARVDGLHAHAWWTSVGREWSHPRLRLEDTRQYTFSWGRATVYFYRVQPHAGVPSKTGALPDARKSFERVLSDSLHKRKDET